MSARIRLPRGQVLSHQITLYSDGIDSDPIDLTGVAVTVWEASEELVGLLSVSVVSASEGVIRVDLTEAQSAGLTESEGNAHYFRLEAQWAGGVNRVFPKIWIDVVENADGIDSFIAITGVGVPGVPGASFHVVGGVPSDDLGNNGDTAINRLTGEEYEKSAGAWVATGENFWGTLLTDTQEALSYAQTAASTATAKAGAAEGSASDAASSAQGAETAATSAQGFASAAAASAESAEISATASAGDAASAAADRVQTGLDRVQTGLDVIATASSREAAAEAKEGTAEDVAATAADRQAVETAATEVETNRQAVDTAAGEVESDRQAVETAATAVEEARQEAVAAAEAAEVAKMTWRGSYDAETAYALRDVVEDGGSSWVNIQAGTGNAPPTLPTTENDYWELSAAKGEKGEPGADGQDGPAAVSIGTVTTVEPGEPATVTNVGTASVAVLDFGIPRGEQGAAGAAGEPLIVNIQEVGGINAGTYPATRFYHAAATFGHIYAEVLVGTGEAEISVYQNDEQAYGPVTVEAGTPVDADDLGLTLAAGDAVDVVVESADTTVIYLQVQMDGSV